MPNFFKILILKSILHLRRFSGLFIAPIKTTETHLVKDLIRSVRPFSTDKKLIRIGMSGDGGYLIPDDLDNIEACFSPGVGYISRFEKECADMGMKVFLADKSVNGPAEKHKNFNFIKKFLGPQDDESNITLETWVNQSVESKDSDLLLQMDIEGHEYITLLTTPDNIIERFRIIQIEIHFMDKIWIEDFYSMLYATLAKLTRNHTCVHIHPVNKMGMFPHKGIVMPRGAEFTFYRNDRITEKKPATQFPHPLDEDNNSDGTVVLPEIWYKDI